MTEVHAAILVALQGCLTELRKSLPNVDASLFNLQEGMFKSHDVKLRLILDPEWHRLSLRTKQLISDLKTVRSLLEYLLRYDAVTFYTVLESLKSSNVATSNSNSSRTAANSGRSAITSNTTPPSLWSVFIILFFP